MILPASYNPDWIKGKRKLYSKSDPTIMEKVIYALSLVEQLVQTGLNFTFKGGTSLLLILPEPKRFSIDVDIVTTESREKIEAAITDVCKKEYSANGNSISSEATSQAYLKRTIS